MPLNFKNDTPSTSPLGPNDRLFGAPNGTGAETQSYSREAILNYLVSALAAVASSGSASDLTIGTLPLGRLHAWLQDISSINAPAVGQVIAYNGTDFTAQYVTDVTVGGLTAANNLSDLANTTTALGNLGLGATDSPTFTNLMLDGYLDLTEISAPSAPSANHARIWAEDNNGFSVLHWKDSDSLDHELSRDLVRVVRNTTGSALAKGAAVYISGSTGTVPNVALAQANSNTTMPAYGLVTAEIANNSFGQVMTAGDIRGIDTSGFSAGDVLYVSAATPGALTATVPSGTNIPLRVGVVITSNPANGVIGITIGGQIDPATTQTLTNKTIALGSNTVSGTKAEFDTAATDGDFLWGDSIGSTVQAYSALLADVSSASWAQGDVMYFNGTNLVRLAAGTSGQFLKTLGAGANPAWDTVAGSGDVSSNTASSVDSEIALFSSTGGKTIKRATTTGILKGASGVLSAATPGTDYIAPGGALGTPSSGTLTNATGLPVSGITSSTSTALGVGSLELGHASDTTLSRSAAGEMAVEGTLVKKVGKETVFIPAGAMTARTTNGAASGTTELATNDVMLSSLDFDQTTEEGAGFWIAMPKSWNESTVTFKPFWTAASGSGGVVWGLAAYSFSDDDAIDTAVSGQQTSTDTLITANDMHIGPESSAITIGGTPAEGDMVYFEITREVANGSDTLSADAKLLGVHVYITTNASTDA